MRRLPIMMFAVAVGIGAAPGSSQAPRSLHRTAIAGIPSDVPGQFSTTWTYMKTVYRTPPPDTTRTPRWPR